MSDRIKNRQIKYLRDLIEWVRDGDFSSFNVRDIEHFMEATVDWTFLNDCFVRDIKVQDVDGTLESKGHFLSLEAKSTSQTIKPGQGMYWEKMVHSTHKRSSHSVIFIWGYFGLWRKPKIHRAQILTKEGISPQFSTTTDEVHDMVKDWFYAAEMSLNQPLKNPLLDYVEEVF